MLNVYHNIGNITMLSSKSRNIFGFRNYSTYKDLNQYSKSDIPLGIQQTPENMIVGKKQTISTHALIVGGIIERYVDIEIIRHGNSIGKYIGVEITCNYHKYVAKNSNIGWIVDDKNIYEKLNCYSSQELLNYLKLMIPAVSPEGIIVVFETIKIMENDIKNNRE